MAKHKVVKATKEVKSKKVSPKREKSNIEANEYSETTQQILSAAKKIAKATAKQTVPGTLRLYVGESPILRITGLTKEMPSVNIRPKMRGEDKAEFSTKTGIEKTAKLWKCVGSTYAFDREKGTQGQLMSGLTRFFGRASKIVG